MYGNVTKEEIDVSLSDSDGADVQGEMTHASQLTCQGKFANSTAGTFSIESQQ